MRIMDKIFDVELGAIDGIETFQSSGLFGGGVCGLAVPDLAKGKSTEATQATVWEINLDGTSVALFGSLGEDRKRWTEAQVVRFCRDHRDKLRTNGFSTFFEMKGNIVARVRFFGKKLKVDVYSFSRDYKWRARHKPRLVSLQ